MRMTAFMTALLSTALVLAASPVLAQEAPTTPARTDLEARIASLEKQLESTTYQLDILNEKIDDVLWFERVGSRYGPTSSYPGIWIAAGRRRSCSSPTAAFMATSIPNYIHIIRELMVRGYVVVAPEHRGSTGSPAWNAVKLQRPLLIHATTNDRDVNIIEVEHLIAQLRAAGKDFQYRIYEDAPGGHSFDRIDLLAHTARQEIYAFLAQHL